jgi:hypothetical protein
MNEKLEFYNSVYNAFTKYKNINEAALNEIKQLIDSLNSKNL